MTINEDAIRDALESYAKTGRADNGLIVFYTPRQAAAALGKHPETVYRMLNRGELEGYRMGGTWYVPAVRSETFVPLEDAPPVELEEHLELSPRVLVRRFRVKDAA